MAIGEKCQSTKSFLEKYFETFAGLDGDALISHGVNAMFASAAETELIVNNVSIGVLGRGQDFRTLTKEEVMAVLAAAGGEEQMQFN